MTREVWKQIPTFPAYEASSQGRVRRAATGRVLSNYLNSTGYLYCKMMKDGKPYCNRVHRLIAKTFIEKDANKDQIDHIDNVKTNNHVCNLRWCTHQDNMRNRGGHRNSLSEYRGVTSCTKGISWRAQINVNGRFMHLGTFRNERDAARAYNEAARQHFGEFARLNVLA